MARKRHRRSVAGLVTTEVTTVSSGRHIPDKALEWTSSGLPMIEAYWRRRRYLRSVSARPRSHSRAWYAKEILRYIDRANRERAKARPTPADLEAAAHYAVNAGLLHGAAFVQFGLGDHARRMMTVQANNRRNARKDRSRPPLESSLSRDDQIINAHTDLRSKFPYSRRYSKRWVADQISRRLGVSAGAIRHRLTALGLR